MALRCTRIWCVRPVAIATRSRVTPFRSRDHVTRVTAWRARPARVDIFTRFFGIAADRGVDALALLHQAPRQRHVFLLDFAIVELARQLLVRVVVLGDHHHARRALVEAMDDAGPLLAADAAQVLDVMEQRVDQRAARDCRRPDARPCRPAC